MRLVLVALAAAGVVAEDWRGALQLDEDAYVQRRGSGWWRAELDLAVGFDLSRLGRDHPLVRSQVSEAGWIATHQRWVERSPCGGAAVAGAAPGVERSRSDGDGDGVFEAPYAAVHPVCVGDVDIEGGGHCGDATCGRANRGAPWASDLPSPYYSEIDVPIDLGPFATACSQAAAADPVVNPITGFSYAIDGALRILGRAAAADGAPASGALVRLWHADPFGVAPGGGWTPLAAAHASAGTLPAHDAYAPLRDKTGCRGAARTGADGGFSFDTADPGAYGPPQHVELAITAPGFVPFYTKVYLGDDPHLLALARDNLASLEKERRVVAPRYVETSAVTVSSKSAPLADLRNRTLTLNITLEKAPASVADFEGTWTDGVGFVEIASNGGRLVATEAPSRRTWGAVGATHAGPYALVDATFRAGARPSTGSWTPSNTVAGDGAVIRWSHGEVWRRAVAREAFLPRYRYLRLRINETLRTRAGGGVSLNEVTFYGGVVVGGASSARAPSVPLTGREAPTPFSCTATSNSEDCFKAFDGDDATVWESSDVRGWAGALTAPQVVTLDAGAASAFRPTALRIACGSRHISLANVGALNCPKFFTLEGAPDGEDPEDPGAYVQVFAHRVINTRHNGARSLGPDGATYEFAAGSRFFGRSPGERCGSCDAGAFRCAENAPDRTCASSWCGDGGACAAAVPPCPPGAALVTTTPDDFRCERCESGRASPAGAACDGRCEIGFYCPAGSASSRARPCGSAAVHCPAGTAAPLAVAAGYYAIFGSRSAGAGATGQAACPPGSYCEGGVPRVCPAGTFGNATGLRSSGCSGLCRSAGFSCAEGSVLPQICPPGYFCLGNGAAKVPCPPGTFGRSEGLANALCDGPCPRGFYCPAAAATDPRRRPCPSGTYGSRPGLKDAACAGRCAPGHYCPANSTRATERDCGEATYDASGRAVAAYCPEGSGAPAAAAPGYYASGGSRGRRETQTECEPGSQCVLGFSRPCEAGTYRSSPGLESAAGSGLWPARPATGDASCDACPRGHYCPTRTETPVPCPAGLYGNATGLGDAACDGICARGHYCPPGTLLPRQFPCPGGSYGNVTGLASAACSTACASPGAAAEPAACAPARCEEGYFCPPASTHGRMRECGEGAFCPAGAAAPTPLDAGMVGVGGGGPTTRTGQATCPGCCPEGTHCADPRAALYEPL